jgi:twitching motility protein PilJ
MRNPIWNIAAKVFSALSAVLLVLGTLLVSLSNFGYIQNSASGIAALIAATALTLFTLAALNFAHGQSQREMDHAAKAAHLLSNGEPFDETADTELLESLQGISEYLKEKASVANRIAQGDLSLTVIPRTDADVLGHSFQVMIERLRVLVQTKEMRDKLQHSVTKLRDEVAEVSSGDLTVSADTRSETTGEIAVAFNSMTGNFRSLIKKVKDATIQVGTYANAINDTTEQLARGSVVQASQIARTTSAIASMTVQIQEVSENAAHSARVSAESLENARLGTVAARENIEAMESIRKQVQETAKRIKRLGERSQEISQIVALIDDLSDRTSLLALNASLQAAAAGETGSGFALVADEVERLAERSNKLTNQIAELTQGINSETKEAVAAMEETIREVILGSSRADRAGRSLVEIEQVSEKLTELLRSITESARFQAKSSEDISNAMSSISEVTALVESSSNRAAESVRVLVQLSHDLRSSISPFKLPADMPPPRQSAGSVGTMLN